MTIAGKSTQSDRVSDGKFTKDEHLLKSKDFRIAYRGGRSVKRGGIVLVAAGNGLGRNRLGFSIGSSGVKSACKRNRLRRLFREAYRKNRSLFSRAHDIVIIIKKSPGNGLLYADACRLLLSLAGEAGILI